MVGFAGLSVVVGVLLATRGGGSDETELRKGETLHEAPAFRFVVPSGWVAVENGDGDPGTPVVYLLDDDSEEARAHVDDGLSPVAVLRTPPGPASPEQRAVDAADNARQSGEQLGFPIDVAGARRLDGRVDGEEAWSSETAFDQPSGGPRVRYSSIFFAHDGVDYEIRVETRAERFAFVEEWVVARLLESWRWT